MKHVSINSHLANTIMNLKDQYWDQLTDFEKGIVQDRFDALKEYGLRAVLTPRQRIVINRIHRKFKTQERIEKVGANEQQRKN